MSLPSAWPVTSEMLLVDTGSAKHSVRDSCFFRLWTAADIENIIYSMARAWGENFHLDIQPYQFEPLPHERVLPSDESESDGETDDNRNDRIGNTNGTHFVAPQFS